MRLALVFLLATACSMPTEPLGAVPLVGRYELARVNDGGLPCIVAVIPPEIVRWRRGSLTLNADSTFVDSLFGEVDARPFGPFVLDSSATVGTYSIVGDSITLAPSDRVPYSMAMSEGTMTRFIPRQHLSAVLLDLTLWYVKH